MWTHRNNVFFNGAKYNPVSVIEFAKKIFHKMSVYGNCIVPNLPSEGNRVTIQRWTSHLQG